MLAAVGTRARARLKSAAVLVARRLDMEDGYQTRTDGGNREAGALIPPRAARTPAPAGWSSTAPGRGGRAR